MFKKLLAEDVLAVIKRIGPCQPSDIKKHIEGSDTMMIGALISSLIGKGQVLVTKTKKGGSPFYYTQEQTPQLVKVAQYLNEKDMRAYQMLEQSRVLRDNDLTPLVRVCLRNIPDFAKKIEALVDNQPEIFWRYFLVPEQETPPMIKKILGIDEVPQTQEIPHEEPEEEPKKPEKQSTLSSEEEPGQDDDEKEEQEEEDEHEDIKANSEDIDQLRKEVEELKKIIAQNNIKAPDIKPDDKFVTEAKKAFLKSNVQLIDHEVIKRNKEFTCIAELTTPVGALRFYGYGKAKKRLNEEEVTQGFENAQKAGLPLMCISREGVLKKLEKDFDKRFPNTIVITTA